jgi:hypothetical protein
MTKILLTLILLLAPSLASAAYDSVSLTTDVDLSVNSITLDISGASAAVESIDIRSDSFTAVLQAGSTLRVSSADLKKLVYDVLYSGSAPQVSNVCTGSESSLTVTSNATTTLIVTPTSSVCTAPSTSPGGGITNTRSSSRSSASQVTVAVPAVVAETPAATVTAAMSTRSRGAEVRSLQQFLNTRGFTVADSGPGSPGNETTIFGNLTVKAVQKFQEYYGIVSSGTPDTTGYGRVGPKTRAKINELSGN